MSFIRYSWILRAVFLAAGFLLWPAPAQTPAPDLAPVLAVRGDIRAPLALKAADLAGMPRQSVSVTAEDGSKASYEGVPLREILKRAGIPMGKELRGKALASYLLAKARDGYQVVFSLGEIDGDLGNAPLIVADKRDGKPMSGSQGPFRLVCSNDKAGARSVRMLETLEFVRLQK